MFDGNLSVEWGGTVEFSQPTPSSLLMTMIEQGEYNGAGGANPVLLPQGKYDVTRALPAPAARRALPQAA